MSQPKITITWRNDDWAEVAYDEIPIITVDHDTFDRAAMSAVLGGVKTLAEALDVEVVTVGTPGVR